MIRLTLDNIDELNRAFDPSKVLKALDRAVAAAAARVRTGISKEVRVRYNIKAGDIGGAVTLKPVRSGDVINRLLVYTGGRLSLRKFGANKRIVDGRPGASVLVKKENGRKILQGGFFALGLNAKPGETPEQLWKRQGDPRPMRRGKYKGRVKQPIVKLTGPSIPTMVQNKDVLTNASTLAGDVMRREFTRQMQMLMDKTGATG